MITSSATYLQQLEYVALVGFGCKSGEAMRDRLQPETPLCDLMVTVETRGGRVKAPSVATLHLGAEAEKLKWGCLSESSEQEIASQGD